MFDPNAYNDFSEQASPRSSVEVDSFPSNDEWVEHSGGLASDREVSIEENAKPVQSEAILRQENSDGSSGESVHKPRTGAGEAVLLGALASGVNKPTWFVVKIALIALVASLILVLHVAILTSSFLVVVHVLLLITLASGLFFLLNWFICQTGLVSVEKQMIELQLIGDQAEAHHKFL